MQACRGVGVGCRGVGVQAWQGCGGAGLVQALGCRGAGVQGCRGVGGGVQGLRLFIIRLAAGPEANGGN